MIKIYHNHIPRTGGGYILSSLTKANAFLHIKKYWRDDAYFDLPDTNRINNADFTSGHFGVEPNIIYPEFETVTTLRNPIKRTISHFVAMRRFYETENIFSDKVKGDLKLLFDHWLNSELDMLSKSNFQARYLTNTLSKKLYEEVGKVGIPEDYSYENDRKILSILTKGWGIDDKEPILEDAQQYIKQCTLVGKTEEIHIFVDSLIGIINDRYKINIINPKIQERVNPRPQAEEIYNSLSKQNIDLLTKLNEIDLSLWESLA